MLHFRWVRIMLLRSLSKAEIDAAEDMCMEWRQKMERLYSNSTLLNKPNFHNVIHVFQFARRWGPPILYWTRPYEHKHKVFRQFVSEGNHQDDERWCAQRHAALMSLRWVYGICIGATKQSQSLHLKKGARIMYKHPPLEHQQYGIVDSWDENSITVRTLRFLNFHKYHYSPYFATSVAGATVVVPRAMYLGHFDVTVDNYVNTFVLLNMVKK
jgi:hypothetical protein